MLYPRLSMVGTANSPMVTTVAPTMPVDAPSNAPTTTPRRVSGSRLARSPQAATAPRVSAKRTTSSLLTRNGSSSACISSPSIRTMALAGAYFSVSLSSNCGSFRPGCKKAESSSWPETTHHQPTIRLDVVLELQDPAPARILHGPRAEDRRRKGVFESGPTRLRASGRPGPGSRKVTRRFLSSGGRG